MVIITPHVAVDCVIKVGNGIVLITRKKDPFKGALALPGGFVEVGETVEDACRREILEETGLTITNIKLVGIYSNPERDPRRHVISITYFTESDGDGLMAGDDAAKATVVQDFNDITLAFDHKKILSDALNQF